MINRISYTALGVALLAGASAANAQTVIEQPRARTVETVRTVRTVEPARAMTRRHIARRAPAGVITTTTTRTIVRDRVIPEPTVIGPAPVAPAVADTYGDMAPPLVADVPYSRPLYNVAPGPVITEPAYSRPLYDVAAPVVAPAPVGAAPFVGAAPAAAAAQSGVPIPGYRYVYEADRILVIDPYTNIAVQAIPR